MRFGLTMVEMLVSLAILSALVLSLVAWTRTAGGMSARVLEQTAWRQAAERVLTLVHDDLVLGDLAVQSRVELRDGALEILTRTSHGPRGPIRHHYERAAALDRLQRHEFPGDGTPRIRPLIDSVDEWSCRIDEEMAVLQITIRSTRGATLARTLALP